MKIHSTATNLSTLDKWFYHSFLKSISLDGFNCEYPRFSYNNVLFNGTNYLIPTFEIVKFNYINKNTLTNVFSLGSFFISVSMLPHGQTQLDFSEHSTVNIPNLVKFEINEQRDRQTDRQTDRQIKTAIQTDRGRQRNRQVKTDR